MSADGRRRVLIAGGGVAALEAALALRELAADRVEVTLLSPSSSFSYQPLAVAAPFELGEVARFELAELARAAGTTLLHGALTGVDVWRHVAHTSTNHDLSYDILLVACGALPVPAVPGALTFRGAADVHPIRRLLDEIDVGDVRSVAFVVPWGAVWALPAYELALLTALRLGPSAAVELAVVTPEAQPLQQFGPPATAAIRNLLEERGVALRTSTYATSFGDGRLELRPAETIDVDRVVALPRLQGAPIDGIPQTISGFVPVDAHGRVHGVDGVFAAGDITSFTVKQGGIATQQADAAAEAIAAAVGADVEPRRFRPVLRGLLLTGREPQFLRRELSIDPGQEPLATVDSLWWPPAKIVGRHLGPFLASFAGADWAEPTTAAVPGAVEVEVVVDAEEPLGHELPPLDARYEVDDDRVEEAMSVATIVAPEDSLGEVAERLVANRARAAVVAEYGRVLGILTTSDLVRAAAARVSPSDARARMWMTAEPIAVAPGYPLSAAAAIMAQHGIAQLPIVEGDRVLGLLELDDARDRAVPAGIGLGLD